MTQDLAELELMKHECLRLMRKESIHITDHQWDEIFHRAIVSIGRIHRPRNIFNIGGIEDEAAKRG